MIQTVCSKEESELDWIDLENPTPEELLEIGKRFGLHETSIQDCLESEHLPKFERFGSTLFLIVRSYDLTKSLQPQNTSGNYLTHTRKLAIFASPSFLITIHRTPHPYLDKVKAQGVFKTPQTLIAILQAATQTYTPPLDRMDEILDGLEPAILEGKATRRSLKKLFIIKREAAILKKMLRALLDLATHLHVPHQEDAPLFQDLMEDIQSAYAGSDDLHEFASGLLGIHLAISEQKTNDVIRVLTIFSVFFMPLTFIVGVYGMNFKHMPELEWVYGYPFALILMAAVCAGIWAWFRAQGWIGKRR